MNNRNMKLIFFYYTMYSFLKPLRRIWGDEQAINQAVNVDFDVNDEIRVIAGPFDGYTGTVMEINKEKHIIKASISMFGRETPVELDFTDVEKLK